MSLALVPDDGEELYLTLKTDQPILDIAYASGFANLSNFNRRFKELKGCSPKAYRNQMRPTRREAVLA